MEIGPVASSLVFVGTRRKDGGALLSPGFHSEWQCWKAPSQTMGFSPQFHTYLCPLGAHVLIYL